MPFCDLSLVIMLALEQVLVMEDLKETKECRNREKTVKQQCTDKAESWASDMAQMVKNLPAVQKTWVRSLGWEDLLEKGTATHSNILAWEIPWTEAPGRLQSTGLQRAGHD